MAHCETGPPLGNELWQMHFKTGRP